MNHFPEGAYQSIRKELFSYAYIEAISTAVGYECNIKKVIMDNAGIDISVETPGELNKCLSPKFDAQVKCTSKDCIKDGWVVFNGLQASNYRRLIHPKPYCEQLLIVVIVPKEVDEWIEISDYGSIETLMRTSAFWTSLKDEPDTTNNTITVKLPISNRLTPSSLRELMGKISRQEKL